MTEVLLIVAGTIAGFGLAWWLRSRRDARVRDEVRATIAELGGDGAAADPIRELRAIASGRTEAARAAMAQLEPRSAAITSAEFGILVMDAAGGVLLVNPVAERYIGARHGDAVAEAQLQDLVVEVVTTGAEVRREVELYTPTRRLLGLRAVPLPADDETAVIFLEDLTERHRVDAIRKDFVSNASHELKTPLGAIRLLAETLAVAEDPEVRARLTQRLESEAGRMAHLIDDILDLALLEGAATDLDPVSLDAVLDDAVRSVSVLAEEYHVVVEAKFAGDGVEVLADPRQLISALSNLLENAIKYTHASGSTAAATVWLRAIVDADVVTIEIEDHGIGIPEAHLSRIFERFYRVDSGRSRDSGGTGLGLAIVRHVVLNHGGSIDVESMPGEGSTFRIQLPAFRDTQVIDGPGA